MGKKPNKFRSGEAAAESGGELLLAADVAKFAASLGLSGGGAAPAADFDDFAPELASKRLGGDGGGKKTVKKEKKAKGKNTARNDGDSAAAEDEEGVEEKAAGGRDWNFGAGPRPGESPRTGCAGSRFSVCCGCSPSGIALRRLCEKGRGRERENSID
jgi:hypothetical protein